MCWMAALLAVDGRQYMYRVYAPPDALRGDVFRAAFHCHDEGPHPGRATVSTRRSSGGSCLRPGRASRTGDDEEAPRRSR